MAIELKVPAVGESITEVQIGEWLKAEGDSVERDEILVKIETDKVTVDLPAPVSGTLGSIKVKQGQAAAVGDVIGYLEEGAREAAGASPTPAIPSTRASSGPPEGRPPQTTTPSRPPPSSGPPSQSPRSRELMASIPPEGFARVMPSARRALQERGLTPDQVEATGPGGRLLKEDVLRAEARAPASERAPGPASQKPSRPEPAESQHDRAEEVVPMSPFRKRIAERLVQAQQTAALLTTFNEIDMSAVMALRREHQPAFQEKYGTKLGFLSFFVKAAVDALRTVPAVNAELRGTDIVYRNYFDIGVAVGGGKGLAVPVIRNAERLGFAEIERAVADYAARAKANKLELAELQGGTFTITNGGVYGSLLSTPIVNPPQSGILGLHAIQDRPVAIDGQVVVRPMMYVAVTYDHRLVDGREAVTFLKRIKTCVEAPARMLIEV